MESTLAASRYIFPVLTLLILVFCFSALFKRRPPNLGHAKLINTATGEIYNLTRRETSIGRNKNSDILIPHPTVSRLHAVIVCSKNGWYITNIRSEAGVVINGRKIDKKEFVKTGDKIRLGGITLIFENLQD